MKQLDPEKLSPSVALLILSAILIVVGSIGGIPIGNVQQNISPSWLKPIFIAFGFLLIFVAIWIYIRWDKGETVVKYGRFSIKTKPGPFVSSKKQYPPIFISKDDRENYNYFEEYINSNKILRARIIHFSGHKIYDVIQLLLDKGVKIDLLLYDPRILLRSPNEKVNSFQLNKISRIQNKFRGDLQHRENLTIKYYSEAASLRAFMLDDKFLSMGWYTYRYRKISREENWLYGHSNASISVRLESVDVDDLVETFDEQFAALWENSVYHDDISKIIDTLIG